MATLISYEQAWRELERMKVECAAELPEGLDSLRRTAEALLASSDPPLGTDLETCEAIMRGDIIGG